MIMGTTAMLTINLVALLVVVLLLWRYAVTVRDVSFIDAFWAVGMVLLAWASALLTGFGGLHGILLLVLTTLWGVRLAVHLYRRWRKLGADPRYVRILARAEEDRGWGWDKAALILVFLTQAPLLFIVALPAQTGIWASAADPERMVGIIGWLGVVAAVVGIAFETIADAQLAVFRANPDNYRRVLDTGLWRYTRHPNYFGDALTWWGLWLIAADTRSGAAWLSIIGPVFLTYTLTRWSGQVMLEKGLLKTRPGYPDYIERTSGFLPWPPKNRATKD